MKTRILIAVIIGLIFVASGKANVVLPDVIGEAMVIQRDRPILIWGRADPGETVTVRFAGHPNKRSPEVTASGR
jgi:sialate O-acetylesterase